LGVRTLARFLALLVVAATALRAANSLTHARQAQQLLGPGLWSAVLRIDNEARLSRYPRVVHALVFEFADILWFYTDTDGTQSLSVRKGRVALDKADLGPLLREIESGFTHWHVLPENKNPSPVATGEPLPNGCFVESLAAGFERCAAGTLIDAPRLLSYYRDTAEGRRGHTVLTWGVPDGVAVLDPTDANARHVFAAAIATDALSLATAFEGAEVKKARWLAVELPATMSMAAGGTPMQTAQQPQGVVALR
jgi:hypothetical protein